MERRVLAADCIVEYGEGIVLIRRKYGRFAGMWALPGGMVEEETVSQAVKREVKEETGLEVELSGIVGIYSNPKRDERGVVTVVFHGKGHGEISAGDDAAEARVFPVDAALSMDLAFDHSGIIRDWKEGRRCLFD